MRRWIVGMALAAALATACQRLDSGARDYFGKKYSCPNDRVTVKARPDLDPADQLGTLPSTRQPPAEVAADPGRLAKWNEDQNSQRAGMRKLYSDYAMFEVSGCDHTAVIGCHRMKSGDAFCSTAK